MDKLEGPIKLYTTSWCGFCRGALSFLEHHDVPFENVDLTSDQSKLAQMKEKYGHPTVPIVLAGETLIGGFSELKAYAGQHGLDHHKT